MAVECTVRTRGVLQTTLTSAGLKIYPFLSSSSVHFYFMGFSGLILLYCDQKFEILDEFF